MDSPTLYISYKWNHIICGLLGFPGGSAGKESACNAGNTGSIPGLGRSPEEVNRLQYSGLENSMYCTVHGVHKDSDTTERFSLLHDIEHLCMCLLAISC